MAPDEGGACQSEGETSEPARRRIPVTVLSGFLGAGKTTLIRYVLSQPHGYKVAVIQNEFSDEMGMEGPLITDSDGKEFKEIYELPNGCLCCSAKDGLVGTVDALVEAKKDFDYILVEATGIADPEAVCEVFWVDDGLGTSVYLDGVVTLVDGQNVLASLSKSNSLGLAKEALKQVACADVLVLNKVDLIQSDKALANIQQRLASINPVAKQHLSRFSVVPLGDILGIKAFDRGRIAATLASAMQSSAFESSCTCGSSPSHGHQDGHGHGHGHDGHDHGHGPSCTAHGDVENSFLTCSHGPGGVNALDATRVERWIAAVLWDNAAGSVYRCKGLFRGRTNAPDSDATAESSFSLQGVGQLYEIDPMPHVPVVEESRFLFIGIGLDRKLLASGLNECACVTEG